MVVAGHLGHGLGVGGAAAGGANRVGTGSAYDEFTFDTFPCAADKACRAGGVVAGPEFDSGVVLRTLSGKGFFDQLSYRRRIRRCVLNAQGLICPRLGPGLIGGFLGGFLMFGRVALRRRRRRFGLFRRAGRTGCFRGTSRSGATILGAILIGVSRTVAAEYTFFLAVPVMFGASALKLVKFGFHFTSAEAILLAVGMIVAFVVSILTIKFLMGYIKKHDFKAFGWYRIVLGAAVILYFVLAR